MGLPSIFAGHIDLLPFDVAKNGLSCRSGIRDPATVLFHPPVLLEISCKALPFVRFSLSSRGLSWWIFLFPWPQSFPCRHEKYFERRDGAKAHEFFRGVSMESSE
jgi:hypothetical protein